jgi:hypothetical protein
MRAMSLLLLLGLVALLLESAGGVAAELLGGSPSATQNVRSLLAFGGYAAGFFEFVVVFTAWVRARSTASTTPRLVLLAMLFLALIGPWIIMAIAGVVTQREDSAMLLAAPSPVYVFQMMKELGRPSPDRLVIGAGAVCAAAWTLLGMGLLGAARVRSGRVVREHEATLAKVDEMLRAEDEELTTEGENPAGPGAQPGSEGDEPPTPEPTAG